MAYIKEARSQNVHVSFSPKELSELDKRADAVGFTRVAFIRQMALSGKVKGYNLTPIQKHTEALGDVAAAVRDMLAKEHPDRWAYEADIERIEDLLRQLIESEASLIGDMTRRMKR